MKKKMTTLLKPSTYRKHPPSTSASPSVSSSSSKTNPPTFPVSSTPNIASFDSTHLTLGAGVAIFHLASSRVVLCYVSQPSSYDTETTLYFLPKGRLDMNESSTRAAEREGFEESGFWNRLLPLPIESRQTKPQTRARRRRMVRELEVEKKNDRPGAVGENGESAEGKMNIDGDVWKRREEEMERLDEEVFATVPIWTQLAPVGRGSQYILHWYVAETVPEDVEKGLSRQYDGPNGNWEYEPPPPFDRGLPLKDRIMKDSIPVIDGDSYQRKWYEPVRHEGTGVDSEEQTYRSRLFDVEEAIELLGTGGVMADVVRRGWKAIQLRMEMEAKLETG